MHQTLTDPEDEEPEPWPPWQGLRRVTRDGWAPQRNDTEARDDD